MGRKCPVCGYKEADPGQRKSRSLLQNSYYHGVVVAVLAEHTGFDNLEMHEVLKSRFLSETRAIATKNGQAEYIVTRSTTSLDTSEFEAFLAKVRTWASIDLGCYIPEPNEPIPEE